MTSNASRVAICIVSHNSASDLPECLTSIGALSYRPIEVILVDCASSDRSLEITRRMAPEGIPIQLIPLSQNVGFAGGMNAAIRQTDAPYLLSLNPDARPHADFVTHLLRRCRDNPTMKIGAVTGRLLRPRSGPGPTTLDACGMVLTPSWRHLDRGSGSRDDSRWTRAERVFGATGAASLFVRDALLDVAVAGEVFVEEFHSFREDAELSFRLRERGWEILYEPAARCIHRRTNLPRLRRKMPKHVNWHSLKNRYLLRAYHQDFANLLMTLVPSFFRDLLALCYVAVLERSSLGVYSWLWRNRRLISQRRRLIRGRKTCTSWELNRWFVRRSLSL